MPDDPKPSGAQHWLDEIERYQRASKNWRADAKRIIDRYRLERSRSETSPNLRQGKPTFNILWSNVQTLKPAMFDRLPEIIAERRHRDKDPVGRVAAEVLQRAANEEIERNGFKDSMDAVVLDVLLPGRGVAWVRFEADPLPDVEVRFQASIMPDGSSGDGSYVTEDGETAPNEEVIKAKGQMRWHREGVTNERVMLDYVHWSDFAHSPERSWADVERRGWVARRISLSLKEGRARFGKKFNQVELTLASRTSESQSQQERSGHQSGKYGEVWELWDAVSKKRLFIAKGPAEVLEEKDDPYGLERFFPTPRPAYATLTNEDLFPSPDYQQYAHLAEELDTISWRIKKLIEALRLVGIFDASAEGLGKALDSGTDGEMIAVSNMAALTAKSTTAGGGLNGVVQWLPMDHVIQTLLGLYQGRDQAKNTLYEVSGISDIIRGQVDPREKASSESKLKAGFASQRLEQRRRAVERVARDAARLMVELMAELYSPMTIREQSGFDLLPEVEQVEQGQKDVMWQQVEALLANDKARGFRIDVETDSTVEMDAGQTQESRTEFLTAAGNFLGNSVEIMNGSPDLVPVIGEMLLFTVRGYRAGRTLETTFEEAVTKLKERVAAAEQAQQQAAQQPQQPPPDPEAQAKAAKVQQQTQVEGAKAQLELQAQQVAAQMDQQSGELDLATQQAKLEELQQKIAAQQVILQAKMAKAVREAAGTVQ